MKQLKTYFLTFFIFTIACLIFFQYGCKKNDENEPDNNDKIIKEKITGYVQKGPYINGTSINIYELDNSLSQTGNNFNTQIVDNKGTFEISNLELASQYIEFKADGFYFDEVKGEKSSAQFTLYALADIMDISSINVNILTQLEYGRVKYLVNKGIDFTHAKDSAQEEVLLMFGFKNDNMNNSESLDISIDEEDNAILLAISVIMQGNRSVADLTEILANINTDIREDGILNSESTRSSLYNQLQTLDLVTIRENLESRYEDLGVEATIPDFEQKIADYLISQKPFDIEATITDVTCYGFNNGSIDITVNEGTAPYTYSWSNGVTTEDLENLVAGDYTLTVTDANENTISETITVSEPEGISISTSVINPNPGENNGAIDITVIVGIQPCNYIWSNGEITEDLDNISSSRYIVTVTDANSCTNSFEIILYGILTDEIDGTIYKTIIIGEQVWMAENLKATHYSDGTELVDGTGVGNIEGDYGTKYYFWYDDNIANGDTYGALYTWAAVMNGAISSNENSSGIQGVCPFGWHIPSDEEWIELEMFLGMSENEAYEMGYRGVDEGAKMKETGTIHWNSPNTGATNESGFTVLPGGYFYNGGGFDNLGNNASFWSATETSSFETWHRGLYYDEIRVYRDSSNYKNSGYSVRCMQD